MINDIPLTKDLIEILANLLLENADLIMGTIVLYTWTVDALRDTIECTSTNLTGDDIIDTLAQSKTMIPSLSDYIGDPDSKLRLFNDNKLKFATLLCWGANGLNYVGTSICDGLNYIGTGICDGLNYVGTGISDLFKIIYNQCISPIPGYLRDTIVFSLPNLPPLDPMELDWGSDEPTINITQNGTTNGVNGTGSSSSSSTESESEGTNNNATQNETLAEPEIPIIQVIPPLEELRRTQFTLLHAGYTQDQMLIRHDAFMENGRLRTPQTPLADVSTMIEFRGYDPNDVIRFNRALPFIQEPLFMDLVIEASEPFETDTHNVPPCPPPLMDLAAIQHWDLQARIVAPPVDVDDPWVPINNRTPLRMFIIEDVPNNIDQLIDLTNNLVREFQNIARENANLDYSIYTPLNDQASDLLLATIQLIKYFEYIIKLYRPEFECNWVL